MKVENILINGKIFIRTTPSENHELVKVGTDEHYTEAIDIENSKNKYIEVELPPQEEENDQQSEEIIN